MLFWILGIIALFAFGLSYGVFASQRARLETAHESLRNALWNRSSLIPLLLSVCEPLKNTNSALFTHILALRDSLCDEHISLKDRMVMEKKLSEVLNVIQSNAQSNSDIATNYTFIALVKDIQKAEDSISASIRESNYQSDRYRSMLRFPWFSLWVIFVKKLEIEQLEGVRFTQ